MSICLIWCQEFVKVVYYPHHYSDKRLTLLRKLFPLVSAVISNLGLYAKLNYHGSICALTLINPHASFFGQRFDIECANLITDSGDELKWVEECRYLGVYLVSARRFKCGWHNA